MTSSSSSGASDSASDSDSEMSEPPQSGAGPSYSDCGNDSDTVSDSTSESGSTTESDTSSKHEAVSRGYDSEQDGMLDEEDDWLEDEMQAAAGLADMWDEDIIGAQHAPHAQVSLNRHCSFYMHAKAIALRSLQFVTPASRTQTAIGCS